MIENVKRTVRHQRANEKSLNFPTVENKTIMYIVKIYGWLHIAQTLILLLSYNLQKKLLAILEGTKQVRTLLC